MSDELPPVLAIGNNELGEPIGDLITCPRCGAEHTVEYGTDTATGRPSTLLGFYRCGDASYLCAVDGRRVGPFREKAR